MAVVVIEEMFALAFISVTPSQFGFESVVFLGQVLFSEVFGIIAATVSPLEYFRSGYVGVLEVIFGSVSVRSVLRQALETSGARGSLRVGEGKGQRQSHA